MKKIVVYSEDALHDLKEIYSYISFYLYNEIAAKNLIRNIIQKIKNLPDFPLKYPLFKEIKYRGLEIHFFLVNDYKIFYSIDDTDVITILRVVSSKMSLENIDL